MHSFTLLYLFYSAKLACQASIYLIWLVDSSSGTIVFIAAAVAAFAIFPFFHVIAHVFFAKPLSYPTFVAYLCFSFLLAVLWFKPTQDGKQSVLPFAVVTTFDLFALLIFLLQRQLGHWHDVLTSDIEKGHLREGSFDDASNKHVGQGNEEAELRDFDAIPETPRSEIHEFQMQGLNYDVNAINRFARDSRGSIGSNTIRLTPPRVVGTSGGPAASDRGYDRSAGWPTEMVQPILGGQEMEERQADPGRGHQDRKNGIFINLGIENDADSKSENIYPPRQVGTPVTIVSSDIHPAFRSTFDSNSRPASRNNFQTPKHAPSHLETRVLEQNKI